MLMEQAAVRPRASQAMASPTDGSRFALALRSAAARPGTPSHVAIGYADPRFTPLRARESGGVVKIGYLSALPPATLALLKPPKPGYTLSAWPRYRLVDSATGKVTFRSDRLHRLGGLSLPLPPVGTRLEVYLERVYTRRGAKPSSSELTLVKAERLSGPSDLNIGSMAPSTRPGGLRLVTGTMPAPLIVIYKGPRAGGGTWAVVPDGSAGDTDKRPGHVGYRVEAAPGEVVLAYRITDPASFHARPPATLMPVHVMEPDGRTRVRRSDRDDKSWQDDNSLGDLLAAGLVAAAGYHLRYLQFLPFTRLPKVPKFQHRPDRVQVNALDALLGRLQTQVANLAGRANTVLGNATMQDGPIRMLRDRLTQPGRMPLATDGAPERLAKAKQMWADLQAAIAGAIGKGSTLSTMTQWAGAALNAVGFMSPLAAIGAGIFGLLTGSKSRTGVPYAISITHPIDNTPMVGVGTTGLVTKSHLNVGLAWFPQGASKPKAGTPLVGFALSIGNFFINFQWPVLPEGNTASDGLGLVLHPFTIGGKSPADNEAMRASFGTRFSKASKGILLGGFVGMPFVLRFDKTPGGVQYSGTVANVMSGVSAGLPGTPSAPNPLFKNKMLLVLHGPISQTFATMPAPPPPPRPLGQVPDRERDPGTTAGPVPGSVGVPDRMPRAAPPRPPPLGVPLMPPAASGPSFPNRPGFRELRVELGPPFEKRHGRIGEVRVFDAKNEVISKSTYQPAGVAGGLTLRIRPGSTPEGMAVRTVGSGPPGQRKPRWFYFVFSGAGTTLFQIDRSRARNRFNTPGVPVFTDSRLGSARVIVGASENVKAQSSAVFHVVPPNDVKRGSLRVNAWYVDVATRRWLSGVPLGDQTNGDLDQNPGVIKRAALLGQKLAVQVEYQRKSDGRKVKATVLVERAGVKDSKVVVTHKPPALVGPGMGATVSFNDFQAHTLDFSRLR